MAPALEPGRYPGGGLRLSVALPAVEPPESLPWEEVTVGPHSLEAQGQVEAEWDASILGSGTGETWVDQNQVPNVKQSGEQGVSSRFGSHGWTQPPFLLSPIGSSLVVFSTETSAYWVLTSCVAG